MLRIGRYHFTVTDSILMLDWLMLAVPAAFAIRFVPAWSNESLLFIAAGVGTIPLAGWLGRATELLSALTGSDIGGFLNATFRQRG